MTTIDEITENFDILDEWDDRYRYVIELGRMLAPFPDAARTEANKVQGCASQVWLTTDIEADGAPVRCCDFPATATLISCAASSPSCSPCIRASRHGTFCASTRSSLFDRLGLREHLTPQRSNGLKSMVGRIRDDARNALAAAEA